MHADIVRDTIDRCEYSDVERILNNPDSTSTRSEGGSTTTMHAI